MSVHAPEEAAAHDPGAAAAAAAGEHPADAAGAGAAALGGRCATSRIGARPWCRRWCSTSCGTTPTRSSACGAIDPVYRDYVGILINNEVWREQLATVPFDRRLLLLPKCLRVEDKCPAPFDEFGLLCKQCGLCTIQDLQEEAERLGYAVLVAEGSALVMALIQSGKIDAIVGVSCLSVLERAFPYMEAAAIPGVAIPLLQDDCKDTAVDIDWVWNVVHLTSDDRTRRLDLDALRAEVETWFTPEALDGLLGPPAGEADARRPRVAGGRGQALASVPHGLRLEGAAGRSGCGRCRHRCKRRRSRSSASTRRRWSTTTSKMPTPNATAGRRCTPSTACRLR